MAGPYKLLLSLFLDPPCKDWLFRQPMFSADDAEGQKRGQVRTLAAEIGLIPDLGVAVVQDREADLYIVHAYSASVSFKSNSIRATGSSMNSTLEHG